MTPHETALARLRAPLPDDPGIEDLLRYATLAANAHNTQPWRFAPKGQAVEIRPDITRKTPAVDPDDHHFYASLGCIAETLSIAARARGQGGEIALGADPGTPIEVALVPGPRETDMLFDAIPARQCTRSDYDGTGLAPDLIDQLIAEAAMFDVAAVWVPADEQADLTELVISGNTAQMRDPAFVAELKDWIRFNPQQAVATGDGLFGGCAGSPAAPTWLGKLLFGFLYSVEAETRKYRRQMASSAGCFILVADRNDPEGWIAAGRAYQRLALRATALGLKNAFVNQAVEHPESRAELASLIGLPDKRPNFVLRIGRADAMPYSLRRPVPLLID